MKNLVQHIQEKLKVSKVKDFIPLSDKYVITEVETSAALTLFDYNDFKSAIDYLFGSHNLVDYSEQYDNIFEKYEDNIKIDLSDTINKYVEIIVSILFSQETLEAGIEELNSIINPNAEVLKISGALKSSPPTYCRISFTFGHERQLVHNTYSTLLHIEYDKRS